MELEIVQNKIFEIRGHRIMLDFDLAQLYQTETKRLKEAVKRNIKRFPNDFMFELSKVEYDSLRSQFATSNKRGGSRYLPFAFTEQGVAMLSAVLNSDTAIDVNISIMRAFVMLRKVALQHKDIVEKIDAMEAKYDSQFAEVFKALKCLLEPPHPERRAIGFKRE